MSIVQCLALVKTHRPSFVGTKRETVQRKVVNGDVNVPFRSTRGEAVVLDCVLDCGAYVESSLEW